MKKYSLLLATAVLLGIGSAFANMESDIYVKKTDGSFQLKTLAGGRCLSEPNDHCEYTLVEDGDPSNPDDYTPIDIDRQWQP